MYRTGSAANPRPWPLVRAADEAGGDGVLKDELERRLELLVRFDALGGEPLAENVVAATVDGVEGARILAVQVTHSFGEVCVPRLDDQVVVVAHQGAGMDTPAVSVDDAPQLVEEHPPIVVIEEAGLLVVASCRDAVPRAGGDEAAVAGHATTVALQRGGCGRRASFGTASAQSCHTSVAL